MHFAKTFLLKVMVAHCKHFIDDQNLRLQMRRNRKGEAHVRALAVLPYRRIRALFNFGEGHDFVEFLSDFALLHPEDGAIEEDVLAPREFRVKASANLQQAGDPPAQHSPPPGWLRDAAEDLEQRAFAGPVSPDNAEHLPLLD